MNDSGEIASITPDFLEELSRPTLDISKEAAE